MAETALGCGGCNILAALSLQRDDAIEVRTIDGTLLYIPTDDIEFIEPLPEPFFANNAYNHSFLKFKDGFRIMLRERVEAIRERARLHTTQKIITTDEPMSPQLLEDVCFQHGIRLKAIINTDAAFETDGVDTAVTICTKGKSAKQVVLEAKSKLQSHKETYHIVIESQKIFLTVVELLKDMNVPFTTKMTRKGDSNGAQ